VNIIIEEPWEICDSRRKRKLKIVLKDVKCEMKHTSDSAPILRCLCGSTII